MRFRSKIRYDLSAFSWGKFIWNKFICVKNLTFHNSVIRLTPGGAAFSQDLSAEGTRGVQNLKHRPAEAHSTSGEVLRNLNILKRSGHSVFLYRLLVVTTS